MASVAATLAELVHQVSADDLPASALERAQMVIASTLASAAAGFDISSATIIRELAAANGGTSEASVWFATAPRLPVAQAARANAVASDAAASDDSDLRNIAHIGTVVSAAALALGQRVHASGHEALAALVLGYEVASRVGTAITPGYSERGFHGCVITIFGSTAAAAKLLALPIDGVARALAIAATSIGGLYQAANISVAREYHAGLSAMLGVEAALAAAKGFDVDDSILETRRGFFDTFGGRDIAGVTSGLGLGASWDINRHLAIKLVPGAHPYHAAAEAAVDAARQANVPPEDIDEITVAARSLGRDLVYHPTDLVGMAHSIPYFVAAAVVDRTFGWEHASLEKIRDPVIGALQDRVHIDPVVEHSVAIAPTCGGSVRLTTKAGLVYSSTVTAPRGSSMRGIEWADVDSKYRALMPGAHLSERSIETGLELIHGLQQVDDVNTLVAAVSQR
jgi:2-methylcitrate dehydratase PrpD